VVSVNGVSIKHAEQVKFVFVFLPVSLKHGSGVQTTKTLYVQQTKFKGAFAQFSTAIKNTLFCPSSYHNVQLWCKHTQQSISPSELPKTTHLVFYITPSRPTTRRTTGQSPRNFQKHVNHFSPRKYQLATALPPRIVNVRPHPVAYFVRTFNALIRNSSYAFFWRSASSTNSFIRSL